MIKIFKSLPFFLIIVCIFKTKTKTKKEYITMKRSVVNYG